MATKSKNTNSAAAAVEIVDRPLQEIIAESYVSFALFVISERALPSVFDGFKPSARKALWSGLHAGLLPTKEHRKMPFWIGTAAATFYEYGDSALEEVLIGLEAWHKLNIPFVNGSGTWSGPDNRAGSARYISGRLADAGFAAVAEVDEGAVPMKLNYEGVLELSLIHI